MKISNSLSTNRLSIPNFHLAKISWTGRILLEIQITVQRQRTAWLWKNSREALTFSEFSKSSLNAQSFSLAGNSEIEAKVRRNCSADPKGRSGLAACASCILDLSSSVGSIVSSFCRERVRGQRIGNERRREMKRKLEKLEKPSKTERTYVSTKSQGRQ